MVVYRAVGYHRPLWIEPNVTAGRFNRPQTGPVQYFCEHPLGPLAEAVRRLPHGLDPRELRRAVWALRVPDGPVVTLGFDEAGEWGVDAYDLVCPPAGYRACQDLAATLLAQDEPPVLRVPSAALPGTWNRIVLGARVLADYMPEPVDPQLDVPGALTAVDARALDELVPLVRPLDQRRHAAYDAWLDGEAFIFAEPESLSLGA